MEPNLILQITTQDYNHVIKLIGMDFKINPFLNLNLITVPLPSGIFLEFKEDKYGNCYVNPEYDDRVVFKFCEGFTQGVISIYKKGNEDSLPELYLDKIGQIYDTIAKTGLFITTGFIWTGPQISNDAIRMTDLLMNKGEIKYYNFNKEIGINDVISLKKTTTA